MKLALQLPVNGVSFGQTSTLLLRTIFEQEKAGTAQHEWMFSPLFGQVDVSSQTGMTQEFVSWMQAKALQFLESYHRDIPWFKLWHLNGSMDSPSNSPHLLSFYELDSPTKVELNIARNNKLAFSSSYTCEVFRNAGVESTFIPLGFDSFNFYTTNKTYFRDGRVVFNLCGKLEKRKHHHKIITAWAKKFGGSREFALQCAIYNPFLGQNKAECDRNNNIEISSMFPNGKPFNISFLPHMKENVVYNDFLNSSNIIIGMSGGEGRDLPVFQSLGLGKHGVILNAHAYKDYATKENSCLVEPCGKIDSCDERFFKKNQPFNQGNLFDWSEDAFIAACEEAITRVRANPINLSGAVLQSAFSKERFLSDVTSFTLS